MLPLHGQSTAAVEYEMYHWAGPTLYVSFPKSHVFDKQAGLKLCRVPLQKLIYE